MPSSKSVQGLKASSPTNDPNLFETIECQMTAIPASPLANDSVRIQCQYSSINYKDALAVTGKGKILRTLPLIPGIDVSGVVTESTSSRFQKDQPVLITGCGLGENTSGGYVQELQAHEDMVIPLPKSLSPREAMIFGTAGFTAALAIHQLEKNDLTPGQGEILVTGATGGVGCLSLQILKKLGYTVRAWTRKEELCPWLLDMGATASESIAQKDFKTRPLASSQWAAAIDNVGGEYLSYILPRIQLQGSVAAVGLAQSPLLQGTVFPFILRGVNLLGVSSNNCPRPLRETLWQKLADTYRPKNLEDCVETTLELAEVPAYCKKMIQGQTKGRALVHIA